MVDEEFLKGIFEKKDVSDADKIKLIIDEHNSDTRGLLQKRDELLGSEKKLKEQIATFETGKKETDTKIATLEEELKKATSDDHKKYYETQLADLQKKQAEELQKLTQDRDFYKQSHLKFLRDKAIDEGVKGLNFIDGLKDGFVARVLSMNNFEPKEIDGQIKFLNKDNHTVEEAINSFALTSEGKAYIRNASSGGGANGSGGGIVDKNAKQISAQQVNTMSDADLMAFAVAGGQVV